MRKSAAALLGFALAVTMVSPVSAAERVGVTAQFGSKTFNMAETWGGASSCVVLSKTQVRCFTSNSEADAFLMAKNLTSGLGPDVVQSAGVTYALPACANGYVCLWEDTNGNGRRLIFRDDYWQHLSNYGFQDRLSSWRNNQYNDSASIRNTGGGAWTISFSGKGYASTLGSRNDQADEVLG